MKINKQSVQYACDRCGTKVYKVYKSKEYDEVCGVCWDALQPPPTPPHIQRLYNSLARETAKKWDRQSGAGAQDHAGIMTRVIEKQIAREWAKLKVK